MSEPASKEAPEIKTRGFFNITPEQYHADPAPIPSLSSGVARTLLSRSPLHAAYKHPRLAPKRREDKRSNAMELGAAAHAVILEGSHEKLAVIDAADWKTKAAREDRDLALENDLLPILTGQYADVKEMAEALARALEGLPGPAPFQGGKPEQSAFWTEMDGEVWCRARLDYMSFPDSLPGPLVEDYKTVSGSADPEAFCRQAYNIGLDVQAAFYLRGVRALGFAEPTWRWIVQEQHAPYAATVVDMSGFELGMADGKVERAIGRWHECQSSGNWPGYRLPVTLEAPPWEISKAVAAELEAEEAATLKSGGDPMDVYRT